MDELEQTDPEIWISAWTDHLCHLAVCGIGNDLLHQISELMENIGSDRRQIQRGREGQWDIYKALLESAGIEAAFVAALSPEEIAKRREIEGIESATSKIRMSGSCHSCGWHGTEGYNPGEEPEAEELLRAAHWGDNPNCKNGNLSFCG